MLKPVASLLLILTISLNIGGTAALAASQPTARPPLSRSVKPATAKPVQPRRAVKKPTSKSVKKTAPKRTNAARRPAAVRSTPPKPARAVTPNLIVPIEYPLSTGVKTAPLLVQPLPLLAVESFLTTAGIIAETNAGRYEATRQPLAENHLLSAVAEVRLKDMFEQQYFEHVSPAGVGPAEVASAQDYKYLAIGENIALGNYTDDGTLVKAWLGSKAHRDNILSRRYSEIGVAVGTGIFKGKMTWLAVQIFGRPEAACPRPDPALRAAWEDKQQLAAALQPKLESLQKILATTQPTNQAEATAYNYQVEEFNSLVNQFNQAIGALKNDVNRYNQQVMAFNACLGE